MHIVIITEYVSSPLLWILRENLIEDVYSIIFCNIN